MNIATHRPTIFYKGRALEAFDAVIPRIGASITFYGAAVLRQLEMMGVYPVNESVAITRARDKLRSLQLLSRKGIGLPVTAFAHSPDDIEHIVGLIPDSWLGGDAPFASANEHREAYARYLCKRLEAPRAFAQEAIRARV